MWSNVLCFTNHNKKLIDVVSKNNNTGLNVYHDLVGQGEYKINQIKERHRNASMPCNAEQLLRDVSFHYRK